MSEVPKKPSDLALWIKKHAPIVSAQLETRGSPGTYHRTYLTMDGSPINHGERPSYRCTVEEFDAVARLELRRYSIVDLMPAVLNELAEWLKFEAANETELAEYRRLKAKFEGQGLA